MINPPCQQSPVNKKCIFIRTNLLIDKYFRSRLSSWFGDTFLRKGNIVVSKDKLIDVNFMPLYSDLVLSVYLIAIPRNRCYV